MNNRLSFLTTLSIIAAGIFTGLCVFFIFGLTQDVSLTLGAGTGLTLYFTAAYAFGDSFLGLLQVIGMAIINIAVVVAVAHFTQNTHLAYWSCTIVPLIVLYCVRQSRQQLIAI